MAKVSCKLPDELLEKLSKLGKKSDEIAEKALKAGGKVLYDEVKKNLQGVRGQNTAYPSRSTGELEDALGISSVKIDKNGNSNIKVGFAEPRKNGKKNTTIAMVLEYGKHGQAPKPFLEPAKRKAKKPCMEAMKNVLESEVGKL